MSRESKDRVATGYTPALRSSVVARAPKSRPRQDLGGSRQKRDQDYAETGGVETETRPTGVETKTKT